MSNRVLILSGVDSFSPQRKYNFFGGRQFDLKDGKLHVFLGGLHFDLKDINNWILILRGVDNFKEIITFMGGVREKFEDLKMRI